LSVPYHISITSFPAPRVASPLQATPIDPIFELNCWVLGDGVQNIFPVKVAKSESVGALKEVIKDKKPAFGNIAADSLALWKVSIPVDHGLEQKLSDMELNDNESLSPVDRLSQVFSDSPEERHLHIVVRSPPAGE
jgi:hypothetical protein